MTAQTAAPDEGQALKPLFATKELDDLSSHIHRQFVGGLGLVLPVLLWLIAGLRPIEGLRR